MWVEDEDSEDEASEPFFWRAGNVITSSTLAYPVITHTHNM